MADTENLQSRLNNFSHDYLYRDGNIGSKKIHLWHLSDDIPLPSGVTGTYQVGAGASGSLESITFVGGVCTAVTLVP